MGIPAPNYQRLCRIVFEHVSYQNQILSEMKRNATEMDQKIIGLFQDALNFLKEELEQVDNLSTVDIKRISNQLYNKVHKIVKSKVYDQASSIDHTRYQQLFKSLKDELKSFKSVLNHRKEIEEHGLEPYLDTGWGQKQLQQLVKMGDSWAIEKLKDLLLSKKIKAWNFLIHNHSFLAIQHLAFLLKDHLYLKGYLGMLLLRKNRYDPQLAYSFIGSVLKVGNWQWGQEILLKHFNQGDKFVAKILLDLFEVQNDAEHFINIFVFEQLEKETELGLDLFSKVVSFHNQKAALLAQMLIRVAKAKNSINFDMLVLALAALSDPNTSFLEEVKKHLIVLESEKKIEKGVYLKILQHLLDKKNELFNDIELKRSIKLYAWQKRADFYLTYTFKMFAQRMLNLIKVLRNQFTHASKPHAPKTDFFPSIRCVWIQAKDKKRDVLTEQLISIYQSYQVTTYIFVAEDATNIREGKYIIPLPSGLKMGQWQRDYWFSSRAEGSKNSIQYPYWSSMHAISYSSLIKKRLEERFPDESKMLNLKKAKFSTIGAVNDGHHQLISLEFFAHFRERFFDQRFQFTFNEGGNCLIGEDEQGLYALIGKDALTINLLNLSKEFAKYGLKKTPEGEWELCEPYQLDKLDLNDDDMRCFFALDLNITDPNRIYFIEQAAFHLDMAMAIIGPKTVVLNNSMLALEKMIQIYEQKKEAFSPAEQFLFAGRLALAKAKAQKDYLLEQAAALDLEKHGFQVIPFAGVFSDFLQNHPEHHQTNLFNFQSLTTPSGEKIIISLGCSQEHQKAFKDMIQAYCSIKVDTFYFLDQLSSEALLVLNGGVHCITNEFLHPL